MSYDIYVKNKGSLLGGDQFIRKKVAGKEPLGKMKMDGDQLPMVFYQEDLWRNDQRDPVFRGFTLANWSDSSFTFNNPDAMGGRIFARLVSDKTFNFTALVYCYYYTAGTVKTKVVINNVENAIRMFGVTGTKITVSSNAMRSYTAERDTPDVPISVGTITTKYTKLGTNSVWLVGDPRGLLNASDYSGLGINAPRVTVSGTRMVVHEYTATLVIS